MAYLALYRKFRPQTFDKLIGQEHITQTLENQINRDQIGHAYLFCGTRGTGKTSAAKIFARAINCEHPQNGSPCLQCDVCKALENGSHPDVSEIDAASHNGVDEIRELRDSVQYPPVVGKYKVYIIDEVHMLTDSAFNALLKTLEEPPRHVVFLLCTTEPQKLPATILSRCMRFDFKLVPQEKIIALLQDVFRQIDRTATKEAYQAIASAAEGSIRDALSLADRCLAYTDQTLTYEQVIGVLGGTERSRLAEYAVAVLQGDVGRILTSADAFVREGKNVGVLAKDLASYFRDLLVVKTCAGAKEMLGLPQELFDDMVLQAQNQSEEKLLQAVEVFSRLDGDLRFALSPRVLLEAASLKVATGGVTREDAALLSRLIRVENALKNGVPAGKKALEKAPEEQRDYAAAQRIWSEVLKDLRTTKELSLVSACSGISNLYVSGKCFVIGCTAAEEAVLKEQRERLQQSVSKVQPLTVTLQKIVGMEPTMEEKIRDVQRALGDLSLKIEN